MPQKSSNCLVDDADKAATKNLPKKCRGILRCFGLIVYKNLQFRKRGPNHVVSFVVNPCASLMVFLILMCFLSSKLFSYWILGGILEIRVCEEFWVGERLEKHPSNQCHIWHELIKLTHKSRTKLYFFEKTPSQFWILWSDSPYLSFGAQTSGTLLKFSLFVARKVSSQCESFFIEQHYHVGVGHLFLITDLPWIIKQDNTIVKC